MATHELYRAAQVAAVHFGPINESRKRCGLPLLAAAELTREFADLDRSPPRPKVGSPRTNTSAADSMWSGIVAKLNATLPSRAPIAAVRESVAAEGQVDAVVDWLDDRAT